MFCTLVLVLDTPYVKLPEVVCLLPRSFRAGCGSARMPRLVPKLRRSSAGLLSFIAALVITIPDLGTPLGLT